MMSSSIASSTPPTATVKFNGKIPDLYDSGHGAHVMEPFAKKFISQCNEILPAPTFMQPVKILELACGTGRLTKQLLQTFPNAIITATDISPDMINLAKTLVNPVHDTQQLTWEVADIQALPFGDGIFDFIFCQYGYMFCPDKVKAFSESYRVLNTSHGRIFALLWDKIDLHPLLYPVYLHVQTNYPTISTAFLQTPCNMFDRDVTRQLLENAHFQDVGLTSVSIHTGYPNKGKALRSMIEGTPLSNSLIQDGIDLRTFEEGAKNVYDIYQQPEGSELELAFDMHAILAYGHK